jgi:dipeptidyl aminopeptidase/acylaminoacyl peptidase
MKRLNFRFIVLFSLALLNSASASPDRVAALVDSLPQIKKIDQVAISPDGTQVAYIAEGELSVAAVKEGIARPLATDLKLSSRDVTWSGDSRNLAWLADLPGEAPSSQLWAVSSDGNVR